MEDFWPFALVAIILIGILVLICLGPGAVSLEVDDPLDSRELHERGRAKIRLPLLDNVENEENQFYGTLDGYLEVKERFPWFPFLNRLYRAFYGVSIKIEGCKCPDGFTVELKPDRNNFLTYYRGDPMPLSLDSANRFVVAVRGPQVDLKRVEISLEVHTDAGGIPLPLKTRRHKATLNYRFFVGENLRSTWVGLDPGTTGSCVAVGEHANEIHLEKDHLQNDKITPSLIVFGRYWGEDDELDFSGKLIPPDCYRVGDAARADFGHPEFTSVHSFKKLLGFSEPIRHDFDGHVETFEGHDLSRLLVLHLCDGLFRFVENSNLSGSLSVDRFDPKRCVVAVPNTFTPTQTQLIWDVVMSVGVFDEVRTLTEAEAVFFHHLRGAYSSGEQVQSQTVMIFDMGGSTINATVLDFNVTSEANAAPRYQVEVLARTGYTIGGDSIDYCLCKILCAALSADLGQKFEKLNPFSRGVSDDPEIGTLRLRWKEVATKLKIQLAESVESKKEVSADVVWSIIEDVFSKEKEIFEDGPGKAFGEQFESHPDLGPRILIHPILIEKIFRPMDEIVRGVVDSAGGVRIDQVICSGRSCLFPSIRDRVIDAMLKCRQKPQCTMLEKAELKSAVAKGCCWYGLNHSAITISSAKTSATFGYRQTRRPGETPRFYPVIGEGLTLQKPADDPLGIGSVTEAVSLRPPSSFDFDANKVTFFQVQGGSPESVFEKGQLHRSAAIGETRVRGLVEILEIEVLENDQSGFRIFYKNGEQEEVSGAVSLELDLANSQDEHYYWSF